jgi:ArsR family metal-binding transcriptional regulator
MFDKLKFVTAGVNAKIPNDLQLLLWSLIDAMKVDKKEYLQVFKITSIYEEGVYNLNIIHSQEEPNYVKEHAMIMSILINEKLYVIDDDPHSTMLLADEY